ncbi:maleate cis-trans isomerase (plasmid) [Pseudohalocynthiibacter aestuariivivens]|nr:aspartate/glutamate racemase family protein [Pseudohalocynthiibacter aestuariivivens]QIE48155.1 maleate cis-trans isomerase [Pseudohalocynthiibacter aestuariivivens]
MTPDISKREVGRKVGLIIPSPNTVIEPDLRWAAPAGLSFFSTRVMLHDTTPDGLRAMNAGVASAADLIAQVTPDVVVYACTSGSFIDGVDGMNQLVASIADVVGCPVVATSECMIAALKALNVHRVTLVTPYLDSVNETEIEFLRSSGFDVVATDGLGLSGKAIRDVDPREIADQVQRADTQASDAVFVSCTDYRALEVVDTLEAKLGKPVLTSNQVTLWGILRALCMPTTLSGYGRLLA